MLDQLVIDPEPDTGIPDETEEGSDEEITVKLERPAIVPVLSPVASVL